MHNRPVRFGAAIRINRIGCERFARLIALAATFVVCALVIASGAAAQNMMMPAAEPMMDSGAPMTESGNVSFYSQDLGTVLRLRYNTESYGQDDHGNFDIGSFQVLSFDTIDAAAFLDGQVTLNEVDGVGFNIGVGWRAIDFPPYSMNTGRMDGISFWVDGQHTNEGAFYPQIGLSLESLGELWDFRANGYLPLGDQEHVGDFDPTGVIGFQGNSLSQLTQAVVDNSFAVGEVEIARRMGAERDAWAFAGPYFVSNDNDDSAGYRVGVRGYAYPDLLLQFAVSNDDVFHTNASFSLQWFVGRTRTDFQPSGDVRDYLRQPVMRNDYVAIQKTTRAGGIALDNADGSDLRIVHIDSNAAAGGDGTFENPFNELDQADGAGSSEGDILLAHSTSVFGTGIVLQDNQRLLGEGNNMTFTVNTLQEGVVTIPETSPGAGALARPQINGVANTAITLADNNEVANFDIDGNSITARAIGQPLLGRAGNPNLHDLAIRETTGNAIEFRPITITDTDDIDNDTNTTEQFVRGNVTINNVTFTDIGGNGIDINSETPTNIALPTVTLQEVIAISNVTSTGGTGRGINLENTHAGTGRTATLTNYTWDGGTTSQGGLRLNNIDGTFNASMSSLTNGSTAALTAGVAILGDTDGTLTFANTFTIDNVNSAASVHINGLDGAIDALGGTITFANAITNDTGRSILVENVGAGANIDFNGVVTDTGAGILVQSNSGGSLAFGADLNLTVNTLGETAISLLDNTGMNIDFTQDITIAATNGADGFVAMNGGTLSAPSTVNQVSVDTGRAIEITGTTIAAGGVAFGDVNRATAGAATSAIYLDNNTGGPITIGNATDTVGQAGVIAGGTIDAVRVINSANVSITGLRINNSAGVSGVFVQKSDAAAMTVNLSDLDINDGDIGIETVGGGTGALTMTVNDTTIDRSTARGMSFDNVDVTAAPIAVNNVDIDGDNVAAAAVGVLIQNSNGAITFNDQSSIREFSSNDFEVNNGAGTINFNGDIINSNTANAADLAGRSVNIHNVTGGSVTFGAASSINDDNEGMLVTTNTGGTFTFLGDNDFNTGTADAVTITNNTGASISLSNLNIDTTSGAGLVATGGGTLGVIGNANTIDTTTGVGLRIENMEIDATGATFQHVNVNGAANGVVLRNLTGTGQVTVGTLAGAAGSGGTLTTTGDAIILENTRRVDFQHMTVTSAGLQGVNVDQTNTASTPMEVKFNDLRILSSGGTGFDVAAASNTQTFNLTLQNSTLNENFNGNVTGSGQFTMLSDNNDITTTGTDIAFALAFGGSAQNGDVTIRNGNTFGAANASALSITTSGATAKTIDLLVQGTTFTNSSVSPAANFLVGGNGTLNATIQSNVFDDANAGGNDFRMESSGAQGRIRLNLGGDNAADFNTAAGQGQFELFESGGSDFDLFERDDTFANLRNNGTVDGNGGTYDDSPSAPPLPSLPPNISP